MLTKDALKTLNTRAQQLKPVVLIGNNGLTANTLHEIDVALTAHELIKVRVNAASKEERDAMINEMAKQHGAEIVKTIGHVVVLYRENLDD